jgi:ribonuclease T1
LRFQFKCATLRTLKLSGLPGVFREVFFVVPKIVHGMFFKLVLTSFMLGAACLPTLVQARKPAAADAASSVSVAELPRQGVETYEQIHRGGPFAYDKDGVVFGNRERLLPNEKRGYYREYTVKTPGSRDRGARRIICGGQPKTPDACYYTADHYASFRKIVP